MLEPVFHEVILEDQDLFATEEGWQALLHLIPDNQIRNDLKEEWENDPHRSSADKWQDFLDKIEGTKGARSSVRPFLPVLHIPSPSPLTLIQFDAFARDGNGYRR